jgi:hypothetical protein
MNCPICNKINKLDSVNCFVCNTDYSHSLIYNFSDKSFIVNTFNSPWIYFTSDVCNYTTGILFLNNKKIGEFKDISFNNLGSILKRIINNKIFL